MKDGDVAIFRSEAIECAPDIYGFLETEGLGHRIVKDKHGTHRWEADPTIELLFDTGALDLNKLHMELTSRYGHGYKKNEQLRDLYRRSGYSIFGYWEVFHWEVNNPTVEESEQLARFLKEEGLV